MKVWRELMKSSVGYLIKIVLLLAISAGVISCGGADDRKEVYIEKAKDYIKDNNLEKARIEIKNALQIDPKNAEGFFLLGEIKYFKKDIGGAIGNYKKAIDLDPTYNKAKVALAKTYSVSYYDVSLTDAENLLAEVEESSGLTDKAAIVRATILIKRHKNREAELLLKSIIDKNSTYINAYETLGYLYLEEKRLGELIELFKQGSLKNPNNVGLFMGLADVYSKQNMHVEAEKIIKKVIEIKPEVYSYKVSLVALYVGNKNIDKAEKILRDAVFEKPEDVQRITTLVRFLAQFRTMQAAISELEKTTKVQTENMDLKYVLSNYYFSVGMYEQALLVLDEIINADSLSPLAIKAKISKANIYFKQTLYDKAKKLVDLILKDNVNLIDALLLKAEISILEKNNDDAINYLRVIVKEQPNHKKAPLMLAEVLKKQGNIDLAVSSLQQAIDMAPSNYQAYVNFSNFLMSNNFPDKALKTINIALALFKFEFDLYKQKFKVLVYLRKDKALEQLIKDMKTFMPLRYEVYQLSASYLLKKEQYDDAINEFKESLKRTEKPYSVYQGLMKTYVMAKKKNELYLFLENEVKFEDKKVAALQALGDLYYFDREFKKAEEKYKKIITLQRSWAPSYEGLIKLAMVNEDEEQAITYFKEAINAVDENKMIEIELLKYYMVTSRYSDVDSLYVKLLKESPNDVVLINNYIAFVLDYMNDLAHMKSVSELIEKLEKNPNASVQDTVAWYYASIENYEKSLAIYQAYAEGKGVSPQFEYHYGYVLLKTGEKQKARSYLESALKSDKQFVGKNKIRKMIESM